MVCADPFAALEGVAPPPAAAPAPATPNLADLDDLYGAAAPSQMPYPSASTLGHQPAQSQQGPAYGAQMPHMTDALLQPAAVVQAQKPASPQTKAAPVPGGPAPMAPRGNAAVEQQAGRKDPFADLFS